MFYDQLIRAIPYFPTIYEAAIGVLNGFTIPAPEPPEIEDGVPGTRKVMSYASYRRRHLIALAMVMVIWIAACFTPVN